MRWINVVAAATGLVALVMLVLAAHALQPAPEDLERLRMAAYLQLFSACAGLAIANRVGRMNLIAGALILAGATLFAAALYTLAIAHSHAILMIAPVGGISMIFGWALLIVAKPGAAA